MRKLVGVLAVLTVAVMLTASPVSAAKKSEPPPTFDRTVTDYVASWNSTQDALVLQDQVTSMSAVQRAPGVFGNEVATGVPVYLLAKSKSSGIQAVVMPLKSGATGLQTPARILAATITNLFPDLSTESELAKAFLADAYPALGNVPFKMPVTLNDLVDLHAVVYGEVVLFVATPVGAKVPAAAKKLVSRAKVPAPQS